MRSDVRFVSCLAFVAASGLAVLALPRGYKEDFNGCATQSPNTTERERCCKETYKDCLAQCSKNFADDPSGELFCAADCTGAVDQCKKGNAIPLRPGWPGEFGVEVPGLTVEGDRAVPEKGYDFVTSRSAVLVELRAQGVMRAAPLSSSPVAARKEPRREARNAGRGWTGAPQRAGSAHAAGPSTHAHRARTAGPKCCRHSSARLANYRYVAAAEESDTETPISSESRAREVVDPRNPAPRAQKQRTPVGLPAGVGYRQPLGVGAGVTGSSGRIRTYNPPVNSRMLYH